MWNHRDLNDPLQAAIETIIKENIPSYDYGSRREDQTQVIIDSGLFEEVKKIEGSVSHTQSREDCLTAWRSHATLNRQAGEQFNTIIEQIEQLLWNHAPLVQIPYTTRIWLAQLK